MAAESGRQQSFNLDPYISLVLRQKWVILLAALPVVLAGIVFCLVSAKTYRTSATIVVVPQRVPEAYIRTTVTGDVNERIRGIWQEITSRTNLERVIHEFNLYPELRERLPMETVVEAMRERIGLENPRGARTNAFILSYEGTDPVLVTKVINSLANMFIEENLKLREAQARGTADFLSQELETISGELQGREEALKEYKIQHMGELPEQRESNLAMLGRLQQQSETIQENIRRAEDRRYLLQRQLTEEETNLRAAAAFGPGQDQTAADAPQAPTTLEGLYAQLESLRTRYTDEHPDVMAVKNLIAKIESEKGAPLGEEQGDEISRTGMRSGGPQGLGYRPSAVITGLQYQLKSLDMEIEALRGESVKVRRQVELYQERIENTPKREQELVNLTRDYDNLRRTYEGLLARKIEAEQSAALERRQKGEQFRVIDPARVPETPFKPNVKKILAMVLGLAAMAGGGMAFAMEFFSKTYYDPDEVSTAFQLPVVACVPLLLTAEEKRRKLVKNLVLGATAAAGYSAAAGLLFILWRHGAGALHGVF